MDDTPLPLGTPPSLDPIGREIARMKIGDALFANVEQPRDPVREPKRTIHWRMIVLAFVAVIVVFVIAMRW